MYISFEDYDLLILCRSIGLVGFSTYVMAFTALSLGWLDSKRPLYFALVLFASTCVLISLSVEFNLASALIQSFYIVISSFGILRRRNAPAEKTAPQASAPQASAPQASAPQASAPQPSKVALQAVPSFTRA
ncbi:MAG: hypothetical protein AAFQ06_07055 [Pseudomonadota bacterium]